MSAGSGAGGGIGGALGGITGAIGGERGRKGAKRGAKRAAGEFKAPPSLQAGGAAYPLFGSKDASVFKNLQSLLGGNSLNELMPALRGAQENTQRSQRSFKESLAKSGLVGSGFNIGGNNAINQAGATQQSDILAKLPGIQRANLATALPYFSEFMSDIARRQGGRAAIKSGSVGPNAAAKTQSSENMGNAVGSIGMMAGK